MDGPSDVRHELDPKEAAIVRTPARRNHYLHDEILNVGDLEMEQDYGKQERWLSTASPSDQGSSTGLSVGVSHDRLTITDASDPLPGRSRMVRPQAVVALLGKVRLMGPVSVSGAGVGSRRR
jgi:hypothetical protein